MDPALASALATIASAISTAVIMYAAYHWPAGRNEVDDDRKEHDHDRHDADD
jgi:Na+/H+ antiporter NhaB